MNDFEEYMQNYMKRSEQHESVEVKKPKFEIGDVVHSFTEVYEKDLDWHYFVKEATLIENEGESPKYMYEVAMIENPNKTYTFEESDLMKLYHDKNWEEYVTESVWKNGLPEWRGKIYNFSMFYQNPHNSEAVKQEAMERYGKDITLPPIRMLHILKNHSMFYRINTVLVDNGNSHMKGNRDAIMKKLNISDDELGKYIENIKDKIRGINTTNLDPVDKNKVNGLIRPGFTEKEWSIIHEVDKLDISKGKIKDHYDADMTNLQIMKAIMEAYPDAAKISGPIIQKTYNEEDDSLAAPVEGKMIYEGISKKDLVIQFYYNFDYNIIESAWPVRMNNNVKKH